jgi:hypothetical protein
MAIPVRCKSRIVLFSWSRRCSTRLTWSRSPTPTTPGERVVVCKNPLLAQERARKRKALLAATEAELESIAVARRRGRRPLRGKDKIALRVGKQINHYKMGKDFILDIADDSFSFRRDEDKIATEAALDGIYVIRTSPGPDTPRRRRRRGLLRGPGPSREGVSGVSMPTSTSAPSATAPPNVCGRTCACGC